MSFDIVKTLNKRLTGVQAILLSVLVCAVSFLIALIAVSSKAVALDSATGIVMSNVSDVQVEGENIYYLEGGSLHCVTPSGRFLWNTGVDRNSNFRVSSSGVAVWRGSRLQILDLSNGVVIGNYSAGGDILTSVVGDVYTAVVVGPEHSGSVTLTDKYGTVVDTITDLDGLTIIDCGFFQGRELFWLMTLDSTGSVPGCKISTYKPGRRETGSISDMEQVIYKVMFRTGNNICAVGTKSMNVYDYTGSEKESLRTNVYGWHLESVYENSDEPLMLFAPNAQTGETPAIKDIRCIKGSNENYLHFPVACTQLMAYGNTIYGFSGSYLAVGQYGSSASNVYQMPVNVSRAVGITSQLYAVVVSGSYIYTVKLPEK